MANLVGGGACWGIAMIGDEAATGCAKDPIAVVLVGCTVSSLALTRKLFFNHKR